MEDTFQCIEWIDSRGGENAWEHRENMESLEPAACRSVGFVIAETKAYITIAYNITETQVCGRITIPKCCIKKRIPYQVEEQD